MLVWCPIHSFLGIYLVFWNFAFFERENEWMLLFCIRPVRFSVFIQFTELFAFFEHLIVF